MKKIISILLILIGITLIGSGCYLIYTDSDTNSNKKEETTNEDKEKLEDAIISLSDIKDFSEYQSYQVDISYSDYEFKYMTKYDGVSNIMYSYSSSSGYAYRDINNDLYYKSSDGVNWEENNTNYIYDLASKVEVENIIATIKSGNATDDGNNSYILDVTGGDPGCDSEGISCITSEIISYDLIVSFDESGFITVMEWYGDGEDNLVKTVTFSNVNNTTIESITIN